MYLYQGNYMLTLNRDYWNAFGIFFFCLPNHTIVINDFGYFAL
jgi:hypothetical protein